VGPVTSRSVLRATVRGFEAVDDTVVTEAPLEVRLGDVPIAVVMRTPGDDANLVTGFALSEGILLDPAELAEVRALSDPNRWELVLAEGVVVDPEQFRRNMYASSSCGVCGKASIDAVRIAARPLPPGPVVEAAALLGLPGRMGEAQDAFRRTGGIHAAAAFTSDGELLDIAEDIGRHNAVDKLVGRLAGDRWPIGDLVMAVSGRVGYEIAQKAAVAGIPLVAGISAASSLAAELGDELGVTIVGFVRPGGFVVYSHPERVVGAG
jgi:FdhD protein